MSTPAEDVVAAFLGSWGSVRDGKITHWRDYWDSAAVVAILGAESTGSASTGPTEPGA